MSKIFINYRTQDGAYAAPLVDKELTEKFGADNVFRDKRSLRPGTDFPPELQRQLEQATVLLALIGPRWLTITDDHGQRRLDRPKDYVRREIQNALDRKIVVIPVLLDGATLPTADELPENIRGLAKRQSVHLRMSNSEVDLRELVSELARHIPPKPLPTASAQNPSSQQASVGKGIVNFGNNSPSNYYENSPVTYEK